MGGEVLPGAAVTVSGTPLDLPRRLARLLATNSNGILLMNLPSLKHVPTQLGILTLSLGIGCLGWWSLPLGQPAIAQTSSAGILVVTGQGSVAVETAIAVLRLGVVVEGESAQTVQAEVASQSTQLIEALQTLEVDRLQTTGITLNPQYDYQGGRSRQVGVVGQNQIQFEVPIDRAGSILDQAIDAGATQVQSVSFRAEESVRIQAREQALQQAVEDALAQAEVILDTLDLTQESIARISVNSVLPNPVPVSLESAGYARLADSAPTPIIGGEQTVNANVTVEVQY